MGGRVNLEMALTLVAGGALVVIQGQAVLHLVFLLLMETAVLAAEVVVALVVLVNLVTVEA
jgi:hypothetical protein